MLLLQVIWYWPVVIFIFQIFICILWRKKTTIETFIRRDIIHCKIVLTVILSQEVKNLIISLSQGVCFFTSFPKFLTIPEPPRWQIWSLKFGDYRGVWEFVYKRHVSCISHSFALKYFDEFDAIIGKISVDLLEFLVSVLVLYVLYNIDSWYNALLVNC